MRVLRPAVALEVLTSTGAVGAGLVPARSETTEAERAAHVRPTSLKTAAPDAAPPISGSVRVAAGPWSLEDGWWTDAPADRDYWDVELSDGGLYRIYRERAAGAWFADGVYD